MQCDTSRCEPPSDQPGRRYTDQTIALALMVRVLSMSQPAILATCMVEVARLRDFRLYSNCLPEGFSVLRERSLTNLKLLIYDLHFASDIDNVSCVPGKSMPKSRSYCQVSISIYRFGYRWLLHVSRDC